MSKVTLSQLASAIRHMAYNAWSCTLIGGSIPIITHAFKEMKVLRPGDLVVEISSVHRGRGTTDLDAVGYLIAEAREPVRFSDPDFVWDEEVEGQPHPLERIFYIRTLDGREFRWENADFVKCLTELLLLQNV